MIRAGWPSMFRGYLHDDERYAKCFADGWYLTGDIARRDADGYYWFVGRADDVIKSAGHLIGPFEVESVLMEHEAVVEAGVIGVPDDVVGEVVMGFVSCGPGSRPVTTLPWRSSATAEAPRRGSRSTADRLRPGTAQDKERKDHAAPAQARQLGLPEGDLSTVETFE